MPPKNCLRTLNPKSHITPKRIHGSPFGEFWCQRSGDLGVKLGLTKVDIQLGLQVPTIALNIKLGEKYRKTHPHQLKFA